MPAETSWTWRSRSTARLSLRRASSGLAVAVSPSSAGPATAEAGTRGHNGAARLGNGSLNTAIAAGDSSTADAGQGSFNRAAALGAHSAATAGNTGSFNRAIVIGRNGAATPGPGDHHLLRLAGNGATTHSP